MARTSGDPPMEPWLVALHEGRSEPAWDAFLDRYRRLVFAAIRRFVRDHDDVMDVFTRVCEALRADDLGRLRRWANEPCHRARFSTWLVTVVRNLAVDWLRERHGRPRPPAVAARLTPLQRSIHAAVFQDGRGHVEAYEWIRSRERHDLGFGAFLRELALVYRAVSAGQGRVAGEPLRPPPPAAVPPPDPVARAERRAILAEALAGLAAVDRAAVEMYVVDELPAADVARILGLPDAKAVYNRVYRATSSLRERLVRAGLARSDL